MCKSSDKYEYGFEVTHIASGNLVQSSTATLMPHQVADHIKALETAHGPGHRVLVDFRKHIDTVKGS